MRFCTCLICFSAVIPACLPKDYAFVAAPSISSFTSSASRIFSGENTTLIPVFNDGMGFIDHGVGVVASGTAYSVSPTADTTYTITVTNAAGATSNAQVTIRVDTAPVRISTFTASPTPLSYGQQTTLFWTLVGRATGLTLDGVSVLGDNSRTVSPVRRQTYLLAGSNPLGGYAQSLTVAARGLDVLAGNIGGPGSVDGVGSAARFNMPTGVAVDGSGNVYVADLGNYTIRKITVTGVVSTLAGSAGVRGSADGIGTAAQFNLPAGVAVDDFGNVYVADVWNHTIRKISPAGVVRTLAGAAGVPGSADGAATAARFNSPRDVTVDRHGNVYVADTGNHTIRRISSAGVVSTFAGSAGIPGSADGTGSAARFNEPTGLSVLYSLNFYVADSGNHTVRTISSAGVVSTLAGSAGIPGSADGTGSAARFDRPWDVAVDGFGNIYVADANNSTIRRINGIGAPVVSTLAGSAGRPGSADGTGSAARFFRPWGVAADGPGNVYVADTENYAIRRVTATGEVSTWAGSMRLHGSADGAGSGARFILPEGVAVDVSGNVYVADTGNFTVRKVTPAGEVSTLAGSAGRPGSADGTGSAARFVDPVGVAVDDSGSVYVADTQNHTIRKITPEGEVSTLAGSAGRPGSADGTGSTARFILPEGVAVDVFGNVYVADSGNSTIRKVTPAGEVSTLAGSAGRLGSIDGTGSGARFIFPEGVAVDEFGNVYVADTGNSTIRKVTPAGEVSTLAGSAGMLGSADGTGGAARFDHPGGLAVDGSGNVYVADTFNSTVRKIGSEGVVTTIVGSPGALGSVRGELPASLYRPHGIALTPAVDLIVTSSDGVLQATAF